MSGRSVTIRALDEDTVMAEDRTETESQLLNWNLGVSSEVSPQMLAKIKDILYALAHEDAIKIFLYAKDGIPNSTVVIKDLGLTQKRYYTRLKLLLDAGILEKWNQGYRYTFLGDVLHQMSGSFNTVLEQKDRLELANKLRKTKGLSEEEKKTLMTLITPSGSGGFLNLSEMINPVRLIDNYEELVSTLINLMDKTEKTLYLVSQYTDVRVMEAVIRASDRQIEMRFISGKIDLSQQLKALRMLLSPNLLKMLLKIVNSLSSVLRQAEIQYSFFIADGKTAILEVPHPTKNAFYLAFSFENAEVCQKLTEVFQSMWEKAKNFSLLE